jgi:hypothetical protein
MSQKSKILDIFPGRSASIQPDVGAEEKKISSTDMLQVSHFFLETLFPLRKHGD